MVLLVVPLLPKDRIGLVAFWTETLNQEVTISTGPDPCTTVLVTAFTTVLMARVMSRPAWRALALADASWGEAYALAASSTSLMPCVTDSTN